MARKQRLKGYLAETLSACSGFEITNILKQHTIKKEESPLLYFLQLLKCYDQCQQSLK